MSYLIIQMYFNNSSCDVFKPATSVAEVITTISFCTVENFTLDVIVRTLFVASIVACFWLFPNKHSL